jgi:intracellular septation protein
MKLLLELAPSLAFFVAYKFGDIFVAAGVGIAVAVLTLAFHVITKRKITPLLWTSIGFTIVFGAATLLMRDEFFIKLKWTLFYGLAGAALLIFVAMGKNPMRSLLGAELELPDATFKKLSLAWGWFFVLMAVLNTYFALTVSLDAWVKIKVFGGMAMTFLFVIFQTWLIAKDLPDDPPATENKDTAANEASK